MCWNNYLTHQTNGIVKKKNLFITLLCSATISTVKKKKKQGKKYPKNNLFKCLQVCSFSSQSSLHVHLNNLLLHFGDIYLDFTVDLHYSLNTVLTLILIPYITCL